MITRRRTVVAVMVCLAVAAGVVHAPAHAGPKKKHRRIERVEQKSYRSPAIGTSTSPVSLCHVGLTAGCVGFEVASGEKYVRVDVDDAVGGDVAARVYQFSAGGQIVGRDDICTSTTEPLSLAVSATRVNVAVFAGECADGTDAMASTGVVTATFSNLP